MIKKIDLENHFYDISSVEALQSRAKGDYPYWDKETNTIHWLEGIAMCQDKFYENLLDFANIRLKIMDELGIEKAVISLAPGIEALPPEESRIACKKANDALYKVMQEFPGRFLGSAILPILDVDAAVEELEHCVKDYGFVMWQTHSNYGAGIDPDQKKFWPVWKKVADLGIFDEIPDLKVVLGHFGEALPFLMERMENRFSWLPNPKQKNKEQMGAYWGKNIFVTTSGNTSIPAFECTRAAIGIDSIMLGTDYPFEHMEECVGYLETCPMTEEEKEKLYYKNAEKLGLYL